MRSRPNYLFADGDLGGALREHMTAAIRAVDDIPETRFKHQGDADIAQEVMLKFSIQPLELLEQQRSMKRTEIKIDVSRDPHRNLLPSVPVLARHSSKTCCSGSVESAGIARCFAAFIKYGA